MRKGEARKRKERKIEYAALVSYEYKCALCPSGHSSATQEDVITRICWRVATCLQATT